MMAEELPVRKFLEKRGSYEPPRTAPDYEWQYSIAVIIVPKVFCRVKLLLDSCLCYFHVQFKSSKPGTLDQNIILISAHLHFFRRVTQPEVVELAQQVFLYNSQLEVN